MAPPVKEEYSLHDVDPEVEVHCAATQLTFASQKATQESWLVAAAFVRNVPVPADVLQLILYPVLPPVLIRHMLSYNELAPGQVLEYMVFPTDTQLLSCVPRQAATVGVGVGVRVVDEDVEMTRDGDTELDDDLVTVLNVVWPRLEVVDLAVEDETAWVEERVALGETELD